jgi:HTH-type transcriptional regulator/antitoxin HipB
MFIRTSKDLGALIRNARKGYGWSQDELARRVGTTQKWISFVENGRPGLQLDLVLRTLAVLRITLDGQLPVDTKPSTSLIDKVADRSKRGTR